MLKKFIKIIILYAISLTILTIQYDKVPENSRAEDILMSLCLFGPIVLLALDNIVMAIYYAKRQVELSFSFLLTFVCALPIMATGISLSELEKASSNNRKFKKLDEKSSNLLKLLMKIAIDILLIALCSISIFTSIFPKGLPTPATFIIALLIIVAIFLYLFSPFIARCTKADKEAEKYSADSKVANASYKANTNVIIDDIARMKYAAPFARLLLLTVIPSFIAMFTVLILYANDVEVHIFWKLVSFIWLFTLPLFSVILYKRWLMSYSPMMSISDNKLVCVYSSFADKSYKTYVFERISSYKLDGKDIIIEGNCLYLDSPIQNIRYLFNSTTQFDQQGQPCIIIGEYDLENEHKIITLNANRIVNANTSLRIPRVMAKEKLFLEYLKSIC